MDEETLNQLSHSMIEYDEDGIQVNDIETTSSSDELQEDFEISVLTKEGEIILRKIDQILDPNERIKYLQNVHSSISPKPDYDIPYNLSTILNRSKKIISRHISISDLNQEINLQNEKSGVLNLPRLRCNKRF